MRRIEIRELWKETRHTSKKVARKVWVVKGYEKFGGGWNKIMTQEIKSLKKAKMFEKATKDRWKRMGFRYE